MACFPGKWFQAKRYAKHANFSDSLETNDLLALWCPYENHQASLHMLQTCPLSINIMQFHSHSFKLQLHLHRLRIWWACDKCRWKGLCNAFPPFCAVGSKGFRTPFLDSFALITINHTTSQWRKVLIGNRILQLLSNTNQSFLGYLLFLWLNGLFARSRNGVFSLEPFALITKCSNWFVDLDLCNFAWYEFYGVGDTRNCQ